MATIVPSEDDVDLSTLPQIIADLRASDRATQLDATRQLRELLEEAVDVADPDDVIEAVVSTGVVPDLIEFLGCYGDMELQKEATGVVATVAAGSTDHVEVLVSHGAVPKLIPLLRLVNDDTRGSAVDALGNIATDTAESRDHVLQEGGLTALLTLFEKETDPERTRSTVWAISRCLVGDPIPPPDDVQLGLEAFCAIMEKTNDPEMLAHMLEATSSLTHCLDGIDHVVDADMCADLIDLLSHSDSRVHASALMTVGNIIGGNDNHTQFMIDINVLPRLHALLSSPDDQIKKDACWALSNITACKRKNVQDVINAEIFPRLIHILDTIDAETAMINGQVIKVMDTNGALEVASVVKGFLLPTRAEVQAEAAWVVSNAISRGSPYQIAYLIDQGWIQRLCSMLTVHDDKVINVALETLETLLNRHAKGKGKKTKNTTNPMAELIRNAGGLPNLIALIDHPEDDISDRASKVVSRFFKVATRTSTRTIPASTPLVRDVVQSVLMRRSFPVDPVLSTKPVN